MARRPFVAAFLALFLFSIPIALQAVATKDATAASLLQAAVSALTKGTNVTDVTLTGTATRTYGSDVQTGVVTLMALGGRASSVSLELSGGSRTQTINQLQAVPAGQHSGPDGTLHAMALHNCWGPADWFFPALAFAEALNDPSIALAYVGEETRDGIAVQHVRFWRVVDSHGSNPRPLALIAHGSAVDAYLNPANALPVTLDFNTHPHKNALEDFAVEIQFSDYQKMSGVVQPTQIEKLLNGRRVLDIYVSGVSLNTGIQPSAFAISAVSGGQQ